MIPNQFIPAVEKGVREQLEKGVDLGQPGRRRRGRGLLRRRTTPVDSSEQAFKTAAATAFRKAFLDARPVLLEPIVNARDHRADREVRRHLRRPRPPAAATSPAWTRSPAACRSIQATVPLSEVLRYATDLKSMTGGQGSYTMEFKSYEPVPPNVQQKIVDRWAKSRAGIERIIERALEPRQITTRFRSPAPLRKGGKGASRESFRRRRCPASRGDNRGCFRRSISLQPYALSVSGLNPQ